MINIDKYEDVLAPVLIKYKINSRLRICHFLAQIDHESNGLKTLTENLNYSVSALISTFSRSRISIADAQKYGRTSTQRANKEMIANIIYGGKFGIQHLGNDQLGDGWKYRGRGPLQCTGKTNYKKFGEFIKVDLVTNPDLLANTDMGLEFAGWYWSTRLLNKWADFDDITKITKAINGGTNGLSHRIALLNQYKAMNYFNHLST